MKARQVPESDHRDVVWRVICGETLQSIADDYGVTRERIRQICALHNVHAREVRYARRAMLVRKYAEEIVYHREAWHHVYWSDYGLSRSKFEQHLMSDDYPEYDELWVRYEAAWGNPETRVSCPDGRICARCNVWKPWDDFYADRKEINKKGRSCIDCTKFQVRSYHAARYVPEPTVEHKMCPKCRVLKPASEFWRSTHNNSGLQTYCKECQHTFDSKK
jgi:hypothetical protein